MRAVLLTSKLLRTTMVAFCILVLMAQLILWTATRRQAIRLICGHARQLPCTELVAYRSTYWFGRLAIEPGALQPTIAIQRHDWKVANWTIIEGPKAEVRDNGVKYLGGRGLYSQFESFDPHPPMTIATPTRFTFIEVSAWRLGVLASLYPLAMSLLAAHRHLRKVRRTRGNHCQHCGYSLTGNTSGVCPECGREIPAAPNPTER